jgi:DNA-binding transcriptional MocR family regulator
MSIYRAPRPESNWTQIRNEIIEDPRLTFKATAVLIFVLSKPDNWRTSTRHLASVKKEGIDAIRTAMSELESAGYIKRRRYQDEEGKWCYDTLVFDTPQAVDKHVRNTSSQVKPRGDYPDGENPDVKKYAGLYSRKMATATGAGFTAKEPRPHKWITS